MSGLKALIFDVDGTIAETERDGHLVAFNMAFAAAGVDWYWSNELYGELLKVSGGVARMKHYYEHYNTTPIENIDAFLAQLHKDKTKIYVDLIAEKGIGLRPGIERLFKEVRDTNEVRLAIATTTTRKNVEQLLGQTLGEDWLTWFDVIATGTEVTDLKPSPAVYEYALQQMNLKAEHCIAFEDSRNGIRSSLGAHLKTIITQNDYTKNDDFTGAWLILNELGEPDKPFKVIGGEVADKMPQNQKFLDLGLLKTLIAYDR